MGTGWWGQGVGGRDSQGPDRPPLPVEPWGHWVPEGWAEGNGGTRCPEAGLRLTPAPHHSGPRRSGRTTEGDPRPGAPPSGQTSAPGLRAPRGP